MAQAVAQALAQTVAQSVAQAVAQAVAKVVAQALAQGPTLHSRCLRERSGARGESLSSCSVAPLNSTLST